MPRHTPHAINRTEYQRSKGIMRAVIVCECGHESRGATWTNAGEEHDVHIIAAVSKREPVDHNPRDMDGDAAKAWREWAESVGLHETARVLA